MYRVAQTILWPDCVRRVYYTPTHTITIGSDQKLLTRVTHTILGSSKGYYALAGLVRDIHLITILLQRNIFLTYLT